MASRGAPRPWWCLWISDPVFDERLIVDAETGCKVTLVKERILPDGPEQYPAAIARLQAWSFALLRGENNFSTSRRARELSYGRLLLATRGSRGLLGRM
jgi:hypothetical protein